MPLGKFNTNFDKHEELHHTHFLVLLDDDEFGNVSEMNNFFSIIIFQAI